MAKVTVKEERVLYNGSVNITFYPISHKYKLEGEKTFLTSVTGATGIIDKSNFLIPWAVGLAGTHIKTYLENMQSDSGFTIEELMPVVDEALNRHNIVKEKAGDVGTRVHNYAQDFAKAVLSKADLPDIKEKEEEEDEEDYNKYVNGVNAFLTWYNKEDVIFLEAERMVYSKKHKYVGIPDIIAIVNGELLVLDYKTSKSIYTNYRYQLSAYKEAINEEKRFEIVGYCVLHFNKETGDFTALKVINKKEMKADYKTFLSCLNIKEREKELARLARATNKLNK